MALAVLYRAAAAIVAAACRVHEASLISAALDGKLDRVSDWKLAGHFFCDGKI